MSNTRYAVIFLYVEQGNLNSEVWYDDLELLQAEGTRLAELNNMPEIDPQMVQVIQYVV